MLQIRLKMALLMCLAAAALYTGAEAWRTLRPVPTSDLPVELYARFAARADEPKNVLVFAFGDEGTSISNHFSIGGDTSATGSQPLTIPVSKDYVRFWFATTVQAYSDSKEGGKLVFYDQESENKTFSIRQLKIELGENPTGWTD